MPLCRASLNSWPLEEKKVGAVALQGHLHQPVFQNHPPDQTSHDATGAEVITEAPGPTPAARDATLPGPPGAISRQTWETHAGEAAFPLDLER